MPIDFTNRLDRLIGTTVITKSDGTLLRRRYLALQRQQPWLYTILLANLLGLQITLLAETSVPSFPAIVMTIIVIGRVLNWVASRRSHRDLSFIRREMRKTFIIAALFNLAFAVWTSWLLVTVGATHLVEIVLFASLSAIGCTYAMTGFPGAARIPMLTLQIPLAVLLLSTGRPANIGIALSMLIVSFVTLRLLNVHDDAFVRLVRSYLQIGAERRRAVAAEQSANEERGRVQIIANRDALTGLTNRRGFLALLDQLSSANRRRLALVLIDLDGFKAINDTFGHASGDALLVEVSRRLKLLHSGSGSVSRLGGDEFAILCPCDDVTEAREAAQLVVTALSVPYSLDGRTLSVSASAGVSYQQEDSGKDAMRRADLALYQSKKSGRGQVTLFSDIMEDRVQRRNLIEQALREPGIDSDIQVVFQPIFKLDDMAIHSFEALARWRHSDMGWISPAEFIPITEQLSVLKSMSDALLRKAVIAAGAWPEVIKLSFNLSAVQLCTVGSAQGTLAILEDYDFDPTRLIIELTETALMADFDVARENLSILREQGVSLVLDDFGAGYSSINYLREMRFEAVKLDGSLVTGLSDTRSGLPLLRGVLLLCESIGLPCVAEHIESEQQLKELRRLGCEFGQGFLLSSPLSSADAAELAAKPLETARPKKAA